MKYIKNILVIDGQGGKVGKQIIEEIKKNLTNVNITAVGTNCTATANMIKGGADSAATGENSVIVCSRTADVIIGPIGIVVADSLLGEVTPKMALAIGQSTAKKILIPINKCDNIIIGVDDLSLTELIKMTVEKLCELCM